MNSPKVLSYMRPVEPEDRECLMPIEDFIDGIESTCFTDDDGHGYFATETHYDASRAIQPSDFRTPSWNTKATHILWFNR